MNEKNKRKNYAFQRHKPATFGPHVKGEPPLNIKLEKSKTASRWKQKGKCASFTTKDGSKRKKKHGAAKRRSEHTRVRVEKLNGCSTHVRSKKNNTYVK